MTISFARIFFGLFCSLLLAPLSAAGSAKSKGKNGVKSVANDTNKQVSIPHLKALVERFGELNTAVRGGHYPKVRPLVSLEQFFKGSNGQASMWFNQYPAVDAKVDELAFWRSLRDRADVWDVLILLRQYDFHKEPYQPDSEWVHSDIVVVISSAKADELIKTFPKNAKPALWDDTWNWPEPHERVFVPKGMKPLFFGFD